MFILNMKALAYLDPGSGSILIQILLGGLLGGIFLFFKTFWGRIKAFFKGEKYSPPKKTEKEVSKK